MKTQKQFILRKFESQDLDQILTLFHDTIQNINRRDYSQEQIDAWSSSILDRERWQHSLSTSISYVAIIDDKIVGFGNATLDGCIDRLYTDAQFQGQGIASALLQKLEDELKQRNVHEFWTEASITARPFFEHKGYRVEQVQEKEFKGTSFRNYIMRKKV